MGTLANQAEKKTDPLVPEWAATHPAWARLEDQLDWYDRRSTYCQKWYKGLKFVQISLSVLIPLLSHLDPACAKWATSIAPSWKAFSI